MGEEKWLQPIGTQNPETAEKILDWVLTADRFALMGNYAQLRACAEEIGALQKNAAEAQALRAVVAYHDGDAEEATRRAAWALASDAHCLRARLVQAAVSAAAFRLDEALPRLRDFTRRGDKAILETSPWHIRRGLHGAEMMKDAVNEKKRKHLTYLLWRAFGLLADMAYLAAMPELSSAALLRASELTPDGAPELAASLYSKYLFMSQYRAIQPSAQRVAAARYQEFFMGVSPVKRAAHHEKVADIRRRKRIGYLSRDFRRHALAYFLTPLVHDFDAEKFQVFIYFTGEEDEVTQRFEGYPVVWRDVHGQTPRDIAERIARDQIDILVDLTGHSQDNALPVLTYRPAPVQISMLGCIGSTGLASVDYFLSDEICLPAGDDLAAMAFTENIVRVPVCQFCYAPDIVTPPPSAATQAPVSRNGYVTFGSFNNLAKLSDEVLMLWQKILTDVPGSHLLLKGKTLSVASGQQLFSRRLQKLGFDLSRVEFRPFTKDYLREYDDVDIALDPFPYEGGLTTCEAVYMGVPVITRAGQTHGSRFGATLLSAADHPELIASSAADYVQKAVSLALQEGEIRKYRWNLRQDLRNSRLMNAPRYMRDLDTIFQKISQ